MQKLKSSGGSLIEYKGWTITLVGSSECAVKDLVIVAAPLSDDDKMMESAKAFIDRLEDG